MTSEFNLELTVTEEHSELGEMEINVSELGGGTVASVRVGGERIQFSRNDLQKIISAINKYDNASERVKELQ